MRLARATAIAATVLGSAGLAGAEEAEPGDVERGRALFGDYCASCHGPTGYGDGPISRALNSPLRPLEAENYRIDADGDGQPGSDEDLRLLLLNGAPAYGGSPLMAAFRQLEEEPQNLADLIAFLRSLPQR